MDKSVPLVATGGRVQTSPHPASPPATCHLSFRSALFRINAVMMGGPEDLWMSCSAVSSCGGTEDVFVRASSAHGVHLADADGVLQGDLLPDVGRYILYVGAGCPFSARPWFVTRFYGMEHVVKIVRCFPANGDQGWFFRPVSDWEKEVVAANPEAQFDEEPVMGNTHLQQFYDSYEKYTGKSSIPVLFDRRTLKIISNESMGIAKALCSPEMAAARTKHADVELMPAQDDAKHTSEHEALLTELHDEVSMKVYKIHFALSQDEHTRLSHELFGTFRKMEARLAASGSNPASQSLMGLGQLSLADVVLFHTLVRFDLAYRWRFSIGGDSIEPGANGSQYACCWSLVQRILAIDGVVGEGGCVIPGDIMRSYWFSRVLAACAARKTVVPLLPSTYSALGKAPTHS